MKKINGFVLFGWTANHNSYGNRLFFTNSKGDTWITFGGIILIVRLIKTYMLSF
jgi:hypothetical protein